MSYRRVGDAMVVTDEKSDDGLWHYPCVFCEGDVAFDHDPREPGKIPFAFHHECAAQQLERKKHRSGQGDA